MAWQFVGSGAWASVSPTGGSRRSNAARALPHGRATDRRASVVVAQRDPQRACIVLRGHMHRSVRNLLKYAATVDSIGVISGANERLKMKQTNWMLISTLIILLAGVFSSCSAPGNSSIPASPASRGNDPQFLRQSPGVNVFEVKPVEAGKDQLIPAVLSVDGTVVVLAQRDGIVKELYGQEGARVTGGQVLATLDDQDLRTDLQEARLEVDRLIMEERMCEAAVKISRSELEQEKTLVQDGLSSRRQFDRAQFKLDAAMQETEKARLATQMGRAKVDAVKVAIEKAVIRAPISGVVIHRYLNLGANAVKNERLYEISQLSPLQVKFRLPDVSRPELAPGSVLEL